jgi:hypothetical protein
MSEENVRLTGREMTRWLILAALLIGCLAAYFVYASRVPPAIGTSPPSESP